MREYTVPYGPALLFGIIVFISLPLEILSYNYEDFGGYEWFFFICFGGFTAYFFLVLLLSKIVDKRIFGVISRIFFFLAIYIMLADVIAPLAIDELQIGNETPIEPIRHIIFEIILFITIFLVFLRTRLAIVNSLAFPIAIGLFIYQVIVGFNVYEKQTQNFDNINKNVSRTEFGGNIYHFVFDAYNGGSWIQYAIEHLGLENDFRGFINFEEARSNYFQTRLSIPSFTTGRIYGGNTSLKEWLDETHDLSILKRLKDNGFRTASYSLHHHGYYGNPHSDSNNIGRPVSPTFGVDLWLLHLSPTILRKEIFHDGNGLISIISEYLTGVPKGNIMTYASYQQFKKMIRDEAKRHNSGEYIFAHLRPPHGPYQLDRYGNLSKESNYLESLYLATNMMATFVRELKKKDRFNSSLIIFQSDHGGHNVIEHELIKKTNPEFVSISKSVNEKIEEVDISGWNERRLEVRSRVLLLVKLPGAPDQPLQVDTNLAQLLDIPELIQVVIESPRMTSSQLGKILAKDKVSIYHGYRHKDGANRKGRVVGKNIFHGQFNWYTVSKDNKWTVNENINFFW